MNVSEAIKSRKSIRSFLPRSIEEQKLSQLLEAARLAPGGRMEQGYKMILVTDVALKQELVAACAGQSFIAQAPLVLVMAYDNHRVMLCGQPVGPVDCAIPMSFMLLEAEELGLGMCWIGAFREEEVRRILDIPASYKVFALAPIGYAASPGHPTKRKSIEELVLHNKWPEE